MAIATVERALHIAQTGLGFYTTALAVASQNLAATGVVGYKKQTCLGTDLPSSRLDPAGAATSATGTLNPTGIEIGLGVRVAATPRNFTQGDLVKTDNSLDLAIQGDGFFQITMPDGTVAYTRAGSFIVSATGQLVTKPSGFSVAPGITFPQGTTGVKITDQGIVYAQQNNAATMTQIGQLQLATFFNPSALTAIGDTMFQETDASGTANVGNPGAQQWGVIKQGYTEASNSNTLEDVINLMSIEKKYNFLIKVLNAGTALWEQDSRIGA